MENLNFRHILLQRPLGGQLPEDGLQAPCPICKTVGGNGFVLSKEGLLTACSSCVVPIPLEMRYRIAGLLPDDRLKTFDSWQARPELREAFEAALAFSKLDYPRWLTFIGGYGTGKTHLAKAILNHALCNGKTGIFYNVPELLAELRSGFDGGSYEFTLEAARKTPLLVLDDLGAQYNKPSESMSWSQEQLYMILDYRERTSARTVITSNVPMERLDGRIVDRLRSWHNRLAKVIEMSASSYRSTKV